MREVNEQEIAPKVMNQIKEGAFLVVQAKDRKNLMTIGWAMFGYVWRKSTMMVAVRKSRFTHGLIEEADSFTVSVPTGNMRQEINFCGSKSGRDLDKFKECQLSTIKAKKASSLILKIPGYHYYYSDVLGFNSSSHCETFFSMRLISNIIATGMISDDFDYSLETQRTMREDGCDQSVSLRER